MEYHTYIAVLHRTDVRSEATVCGRNHSLHGFFQLIQLHGKCGEGVELTRMENTHISCL